MNDQGRAQTVRVLRRMLQDVVHREARYEFPAKGRDYQDRCNKAANATAQMREDEDALRMAISELEREASHG